MTNKNFFMETVKAEGPVFVKVIRAVPADNAGFVPHDKARPARSLVIQLARQWRFISSLVNTGKVDFTKPYAKEDEGIDGMGAEAEKNLAQLGADLLKTSDEDWENGVAAMLYPGGKWETKKYEMAWGLLFDAIHHRGQLSTYIRPMGGKVPSIYGGSADESPAS